MELEKRGTQRKGGRNAEEPGSVLSGAIISCAMQVHTELGPGLLESAYEECLCHELAQSGFSFKRQVPIPLTYGNLHLDCGFRLDLVVRELAIVEIKSVDRLLPVHDSQLLTYLRASGLPLGLLINFNVVHLRHGIRRRALSAS